MAKSKQKEDDEPAKAAVLERSRRSTAGKRLKSLVGQAHEDDDAFWGHSIWSERGGGFADGGRRRKRRRRGEGEDEDDDGSSSSGSEGEGGDDDDDASRSSSDGEGSYRASDDDSSAAVDKFDSDFDESESDEGQGDEDGEEVEEERDLRAQERRDAAAKRRKRRGGAGVVPSSSSSSSKSAGRELMKKKTGKMTKRGPLGEGWNQGLVLNRPPATVGAAPEAASAGVAAAVAAGPVAAPPPPAEAAAAPGASIPAVARSEPRHASKPPLPRRPPPPPPPPPVTRNLRAGPTSAAAAAAKPPAAARKRQREAAASERKRSQRRQFTQEELILEAIRSTETESARWLGGRKRSKEDAARKEEAGADGRARATSGDRKLAHRFRSRRGCPNTWTFVDMDRIPDALVQGRRRGAASPGRGPAARGIPASSGRSPGGPAPRGNSPARRRRRGGGKSEADEDAEGRGEKCVVTGKVARYRDPATMLGYHDLAAYKDLRRRAEAEELEVAPRSVRGGDARGRRPSREGVDDATPPRRHVGFRPGQPTLVARLRPTGPDVRVVVTLGGTPVPPPSATRIRLSLQGRGPSPAEEAAQVNVKDPPPQSGPSEGDSEGLGEKNLDASERAMSPNEPLSGKAQGLREKTPSQQLLSTTLGSGNLEGRHPSSVVESTQQRSPAIPGLGRSAVDNSADLPKPVASAKTETSRSAGPTQTSKSIEKPRQPRGGVSSEAEHVDRCSVEQQTAPAANRESEAATGRSKEADNKTLLDTAKKEAVTAGKAKAPAKGISRNTNGSNNGNSNSKAVPDMTTSNNKRTTIEAN
ncbi:hypothetical protein ACHAWF_011107 [Thalassiosira exigua]